MSAEQTLAEPDTAALWAALERHLPAAVRLRHEIHSAPEVSGAEQGTRDRIAAALPAQMTRADVAGTGAVLRLGGEGPAIGIRGELDALPVTETTGVEWASAVEGVMHACGHDVHMAALVAVSHAVAEAGPPVPLLAVLQPREETYPSGAEDIMASGLLARQGCAAMVGAHLQPTLGRDVVACVPGGVNAAADEFVIEVTGSPGHAAYPHLAEDPVLATAQVVVALQTVVSRRVDPMRAAVLGVSSMEAGRAANVIPGSARVTGTLRALDSETRALLRTQLQEVAVGVAAAHGCSAEVTVTSGEPVLENDPALAVRAQRQLAGLGFELSDSLRSLGADDFSFYGAQAPSLMMFVGTGAAAGLHTSDFLPGDDDVRRVAQAMLAGYLAAAELIREG
ncbi:M20 metallopeptidase family protein [Brevibacterium album]|uniref:M20 metallopeptidase family protein n=1 Tax=Brevibacterium album TaxID=417948 RepID=UPI000406DBDA|nr:M20 family metallopeptidase [Brevibacterium album]